jgi:hypothetical protein
MFTVYSLHICQLCRPTRVNTPPIPSIHGMLTSKTRHPIFIPSNTTMPTVKNSQKDPPDYVMVLRDEVTRITGWHWTTGWPAQNCADTNGYVDVRTGNKYPHGMSSFYDDIK